MNIFNTFRIQNKGILRVFSAIALLLTTIFVIYISMIEFVKMRNFLHYPKILNRLLHPIIPLILFTLIVILVGLSIYIFLNNVLGKKRLIYYRIHGKNKLLLLTITLNIMLIIICLTGYGLGTFTSTLSEYVLTKGDSFIYHWQKLQYVDIFIAVANSVMLILLMVKEKLKNSNLKYAKKGKKTLVSVKELVKYFIVAVLSLIIIVNITSIEIKDYSEFSNLLHLQHLFVIPTFTYVIISNLVMGIVILEYWMNYQRNTYL